ncbi:MAG: amino acid ABC transporter permease [Pseudolabrys sp.]
MTQHTVGDRHPLSARSSVPRSRLARTAMAVGFILSIIVVVSVPLYGAFAATGTSAGTLETLAKWAPLILLGFGLNLLMSFIAMGIGTVAGVGLGIAQVSQVSWIRRAAWAATEMFRNTPTLILLFMAMFLLPFELRFGGLVIALPPWLKAILGFSLSMMAYVSEIVRGGLQSIPTTQWEAAEALAFSRRDTLRLVIIPQCFKQMLPPWMNVYAIMIMSTPLASILGVHEGLTITRSAISAEGQPELLAPFYLFLLALFFVYSYPISLWTLRLERRYAIKH